jgi:hypothetical protein
MTVSRQRSKVVYGEEGGQEGERENWNNHKRTLL